MSSVLRLYNTEARAEIEFTPGDPDRVTFYSCGPTVYDDAHVGNFRSFLFADTLRRWLESPMCRVRSPAGSVHEGPRSVRHIMNITDVGHMTDDSSADGGGEDKMEAASRRLLEAKKSGKVPAGAQVDPDDPFEISAFYASRFLDDAVQLGLRVATLRDADPSIMPRATEHIGAMIVSIEQLIDRGHAYVTGEHGSRVVYFSVESLPGYGKLSGNSLDQLRGGAGGRVDEANQRAKRHPADFMLWKEDARHLMKWESPWGAGYPGWHIECSTMALELLAGWDGRGPAPEGARIDLHSGGEDLIFPHHECELAQARGMTGADGFARCWIHARFLKVDGEKMSKSKGNFYTPRQLIKDGHEPAAIRFELIRTHYRTQADFTAAGLRAAKRRLDRWRDFAKRGAASAEAGARPDAIAARFTDLMHDDLNIAGAIGAIDAWINDTPSPTNADARFLTEEIDPVLGLLELEVPEAKSDAEGLCIWMPGVDPDDRVESLIAERREARASKDFARADAIRDELAAMGLSLKDAPGGKVEISRS